MIDCNHATEVGWWVLKLPSSGNIKQKLPPEKSPLTPWWKITIQFFQWQPTKRVVQKSISIYRGFPDRFLSTWFRPSLRAMIASTWVSSVLQPRPTALMRASSWDTMPLGTKFMREWWGLKKKLQAAWRCRHVPCFLLICRHMSTWISIGIEASLAIYDDTYPLVIKHGNGQSPMNGDFNSKIKWSIFHCHVDYWRVCFFKDHRCT